MRGSLIRSISISLADICEEEGGVSFGTGAHLKTRDGQIAIRLPMETFSFPLDCQAGEGSAALDCPVCKRLAGWV